MGLMKRIFLLLSFLVCFFVSKAQILQKQNTYGIGFNRTGADTLIYIPSDTLSVPSWGVGKTHIARKGTTLYYWDGSKWSAISGSGGTYTAGNGLTLSGSQFKLGGTLTENTNIVIDNGFRMGFDLDPSDAIFSVSTNNSDTVLKIVNDNRIYLPQIFTVSSTTGRKVALIDTATGKVERIDPASLATTSLPISSLTAATGTNDINNQNNRQIWRWNSLSSGQGIYLYSTSTAASGNSQELLRVEMDGINSNSNQTTKSLIVSNSHSGSGASNIGISAAASGGTNNYAIVVPSGGGNVGIGTTTPNASALLDVTSTTQGAVLPRMNTTQMNAISSPVAGLMVYNSDSTSYCYYNGSVWLNVSKAQKVNLVFGAGSGADSDTTAFTTSAIYGSFYNDADTIVVTSMRSVLQGTSPDVTYKVWYNDSLNVEAGATALNTAGNQVTSTTTGTNVTSITNTKIPPGVWVWVKTSTVATKPKYFSLTLNGYRK